jgi:hypothetical protein
MDTDPERRAEEQRFLTDAATALGAVAFDALTTIGQRLGLDYGGIDFSVLPDGRLLVFEANATMLAHGEHDKIFAYRNPVMTEICEAFATMLDRTHIKQCG